MTITAQQRKFILENFSTSTNQQLADALGLGLTTLRTMCYSMGLKRMEMEYWTKEQVTYLKKHYKKCGDKELAETFTKLWPKAKGWTLKHIEKKRKYLGLKRTEAQLYAIKQKAIKKGIYVEGLRKTWLQRGIIPEGAVRMQRNHNRMIAVKKVNGKLIHYNRWLWEQKRGPVPKGFNIVLKPGVVSNVRLKLKDLEMISDGELSRRNSVTSSQGLSDNYVAAQLAHNNPALRAELKNYTQLLELKRQQLLLNRQIKKHEQHR